MQPVYINSIINSGGNPYLQSTSKTRQFKPSSGYWHLILSMIHLFLSLPGWLNLCGAIGYTNSWETGASALIFPHFFSLAALMPPHASNLFHLMRRVIKHHRNRGEFKRRGYHEGLIRFLFMNSSQLSRAKHFLLRPPDKSTTLKLSRAHEKKKKKRLCAGVICVFHFSYLDADLLPRPTSS